MANKAQLDLLAEAALQGAFFRAITSLETSLPELLSEAIERAVIDWMDRHAGEIIDAVCKTSKPFGES